MKILSITAGAANMYCGSCLRDNALAAELIARGHDVTLLPMYTPTLTDEQNVSSEKVFFGGISVYLQQYVPVFRKSPRILDRLWDSRLMLKLAARRSMSSACRTHCSSRSPSRSRRRLSGPSSARCKAKTYSSTGSKSRTGASR